MKQRIIILCGADMTGKSQIACELSRRLGIPYFKASSEHHAFMNDPGKFINDIRFADPRLVDFIRQTGASVVMDRGYQCEYVYSKALGRDTDLEALKRVDAAYKEMGALVIHCVRGKGYEGIVDDLDPTRLTSAKLAEISLLYREAMNEVFTCDYVTLFVDSEDLDTEMRMLEHAIPELATHDRCQWETVKRMHWCNDTKWMTFFLAMFGASVACFSFSQGMFLFSSFLMSVAVIVWGMSFGSWMQQRELQRQLDVGESKR